MEKLFTSSIKKPNYILDQLIKLFYKMHDIS